MDGQAQAPTEGQVETKRGRVRRLVIDPLSSWGMRFPASKAEAPRLWRHARTEDGARKVLDELADELADFSDATLDGVREWAKRNGEGSKRTIWPGLVAFITTAERYEPRRVEDVGSLASWFTSRAGEDWRADGTLVAAFEHAQRVKRPPGLPKARADIRARAEEWNRRLELIARCEARGGTPSADELRFRAWHADLASRAEALVQRGVDARAAQVDAA